ncbi:putative amino acid transporter [Trypanosoma cruzi]|uniref:Putative amino acid transporter n=1 Tax=Trypanosoma cruzi TaxID=5693 RepID=A0A2V2VD58_TRYCR|nr:putative amino acid transporter [Trypanosoma cruzi]
MSRTNPVVPATSAPGPTDADSPSHHSSHEMNGSERKSTGEDAVPEKLVPAPNEPPASKHHSREVETVRDCRYSSGRYPCERLQPCVVVDWRWHLGLPLATNSSGLVMALVYLAVITSLTIYSMYALGLAAQRSQIRTFEGVALTLLGRGFCLFCGGCAHISRI